MTEVCRRCSLLLFHKNKKIIHGWTKTQTLVVLQSEEEAIAKNLESWVQLDFLLHFKVKVYYMEAKISIGVKINHFQIQSELKFSKMMFQSEPGMQSVPWQHVDVAILECAELKNECVLQ